MTVQLYPPGIPKIKRIFDLILTIPGVILISPLLVLAALLVRLFHGAPILFSQIRPGYKGKPFHVYKFRTMTNETDDQGELLPDEDRLTLFGKFLRASSIDELPELYNVLRGEMSIIGPRPLLMQYLDRYTPEQARRMDVLPGITGWAQVNGRNNVSWEIKFELDVWYVDHWSMWLDIQILFKTAVKVITREGISQPGNATAQEFLGSQVE
ncbi:MAG: sugar transferase [Anaerolineales bacterium]|jgi:lipopolysaccharide/colanic/teichoic acid biosynthesis glycosyltransferase